MVATNAINPLYSTKYIDSRIVTHVACSMRYYDEQQMLLIITIDNNLLSINDDALKKKALENHKRISCEHIDSN